MHFLFCADVFSEKCEGGSPVYCGLLFYLSVTLSHVFDKKSKENVLVLRFLRTFAKNTAHNERRFLEFSYLCNVAEKSSQT